MLGLFQATEWAPLDIPNNNNIRGIRELNITDFVKPFTGDASRLRSLDNIGQVATVALNVFIVFAVLSILPAVSHCVSAQARWKQHALATTWLLSEVLDPVTFLVCAMRCGRVQEISEPKKHYPVQKGRAFVVALLFALVIGVEVIFIVGQASKESFVKLPVSQFRLSPSPEVNGMISFRDLISVSNPDKSSSTSFSIPGVNERGRLVLYENKEAFFNSVAGNPEKSNSSILSTAFYIHAGKNGTGLNLTLPFLQVSPLQPLDLDLAPMWQHSALIQGLSSAGNFFLHYAWVDAKAVQSAIDVVATATNSTDCDWEVLDRGNHFVAHSPVEMCYTSITPVMQLVISLLLIRLLTSRMRVGSFVDDDESNSFELVGYQGADLSSLDGKNDLVQLTDPLVSIRQIIPNTVLICMSCICLFLAAFRGCCLGAGGKYANREYEIVAQALGWEKHCSFARVIPKANSLPLSDNDCVETDRSDSSGRDERFSTVSGALAL